MKLRANVSLVVWVYLIFIVSSLHLDSIQNTQLQTLKDKQTLLRDEVKALAANSASIDSQLQSAKSDKERVQILEKALSDERQSVFDLKNKIIYPFNESQTACEQLSDKEKVILLDKISVSRTQLNKLQQINNKLDQQNSQVIRVNDEVKKQLILLQNMEDILKTKCKQNLSPTIFQSNLNAKNWILGPQTMNDLEQQYAQRALIFHNITNCPLSTPFYDPNNQVCIKCQQPNPIFNMYSKQCTRCDLDEELDSDKKVCRSRPHYTNFSKLSNWNLDGGKLPEIDKNLTPCPDEKPYFNGLICIVCQLPYYWSVSANLCKKCDSGSSFDLNTKKCQKIVKNQLTILQNTKWVSSNLTKVIDNRVKVLQKNKTTGNYQYCPNTGNPYYDGTTCISCEYFDIDNLKCIQKPTGTEYNANMRRFVAPQTQVQTNINAKRLISSSKLVDSSVPNCNDTFPYYDGIACIQCLNPFDIFNLDEKKCIACNNDEIYVESLRICQLRKKIFISQNFNKLLATPKVTVPQYKSNVIKTINDNPDAIIYPCPEKNQYSNFTSCFFCQQSQYFNVQSLKCEQCDGTYFDNNQTCLAKVYIFTNLKAPKIVDFEGTTVDNENSKISQFLKSHPQSFICPIEKPYAIENKTCGTCPDLFSYSELKCKSCPEWNIYVSDTRKCVQAKMVVNFTDVHKILVSQTQTLSSFKDQEQIVKNDNPNTWKVCPGDRPYTQNRQFCFNCPQDNPYFNYTVKQCQSCPDHYVFDPQTVRCVQQFFITLINSQTSPRMLGYDNYTINDYKTQQQAFKQNHPYVICNQSEPFGTLTECKQCSEPNSYFDVRKKECSDVKFLINFQKISPDYILPKDRNLDSFIAEEQRFRRQALFLTTKCPDSTPYTNDRNSCFNCSQDEYFNFANRKCQKCPQGQAYVKQIKGCKQLFYVSHITNVTQANMKGYADYTLDDYKKDQAEIKSKNPYQECQDTAPYGTVDGCQQCQEPTPYFDIKKRICSTAKKLINFNKVGTNYILGDGKTLALYQQNQKNYKLYSQSLTVDCPPQTPFTSDRDYCFVCKQPESLFNFETKKCESCPRGASFSTDKKKCLRLFYITNFNTESQKKMVGTSDYSVTDYKADQEKLRKQNPFQDCNATEPYGTLDGCKKCFVPEEYFDIKNRICTSVKRIINVDAVTSNYILQENKTLADYKKEETNYETSSDLPTVPCPPQAPYTTNRDDCFTCKSPDIYFNFDSKVCQSCEPNQAYDQNLKRCVTRQYYTLFSASTEKNLLQTEKYSLTQYKTDQGKIKSSSGSLQCPSDKPYSTQNACVQCNSSSPYFNIQLKSCQSCENGKLYFETQHQCLLPAYMTDFTKTNIKQTDTFKIADAKKVEQTRANSTGYSAVKCPSDKPFATLDGCIACNETKAQYFNIKTLTCEGCRDFYQYFEDHMCKDNIILTNTKQMIGYIEIDNYTKYNVEKFNNFTYLQNQHVVDCPTEKPFYSITNQCISCDSSSEPIFNLKERKCVHVDKILLSNPQHMKFYIQKGDENISALKKEIDYLKNKGVNVQLCPSDKPYLSHNECIACQQSVKYFDLATEVCKTCDSGQKCVTG